MLAFKKIRPLLNRVLVQKPEPLTKTAGGILIPQDKAETFNFGTVVAAGPGKFLEDGSLKPCQVKEGDIVLLPEWGGTSLTLADGEEYFLYRDDDICGTLHEPTK